MPHCSKCRQTMTNERPQQRCKKKRHITPQQPNNHNRHCRGYPSTTTWPFGNPPLPLKNLSYYVGSGVLPQLHKLLHNPFLNLNGKTVWPVWIRCFLNWIDLRRKFPWEGSAPAFFYFEGKVLTIRLNFELVIEVLKDLVF